MARWRFRDCSGIASMMRKEDEKISTEFTTEDPRRHVTLSLLTHVESRVDEVVAAEPLAIHLARRHRPSAVQDVF